MWIPLQSFCSSLRNHSRDLVCCNLSFDGRVLFTPDFPEDHNLLIQAFWATFGIHPTQYTSLNLNLNSLIMQNYCFSYSKVNETSILQKDCSVEGGKEGEISNVHGLWVQSTIAIISTDCDLRRPMTYDNHPIHPSLSHPYMYSIGDDLSWTKMS